MRTKLLILATAALLALCMAACARDHGQGSETDAMSDTIAQNTMGETFPSSEENSEESTQSENHSAQSTIATESHPADEPSDSSPENVSDVETENASSESTTAEGAEDSVPTTEQETDPIIPDMEAATTNAGGVIELPFVPFDD